MWFNVFTYVFLLVGINLDDDSMQLPTLLGQEGDEKTLLVSWPPTGGFWDGP